MNTNKFFIVFVSFALLFTSVGNSFAQTDTTAPAVPRGFDAAGGDTAYEMLLTWTNPADSDLDYINVYFATLPLYQAVNAIMTIPASANTVGTATISGLGSGINYYLYLASVDTSGNISSFTTELKRTTAVAKDKTSPTAIANFIAQDTETDGSINLSWSNSVDEDFFQVRIYRSTENVFTPSAENEITQAFGLPSAFTNYKDTGLVNDTTYYYKILTEDNKSNLQSGLFYPSASATPTLAVVEEVVPPVEEEVVPPAEEETPVVIIADGDLIRATGTFDIYIVKVVGAKKFKRLILSPEVFNSYGHLKWADVKDVTQATVDGYTVSDLVIEVNTDGSVADPKVYKLSSDANSDTGQKQWLNITAVQFETQGYDWDAIYNVNNKDATSYTTGTNITA